MPFELILNEPEPQSRERMPGEGPAVGAARGTTRVFFSDLPQDYKVFLLYFRAAMPNRALEDKLTKLGNSAGNNLLVNLGSAADPNYPLLVKRFDITQFPVIVMTAVANLASTASGDCTAYAKLDSKNLFSSPERTVEVAEKLFNLFLQGKVAEAISKAKWAERGAMAGAVLDVIGDALNVIGDFIAKRDISVSLLDGKLELKHT
jgi:hypothetical protein